MKFLVFILRLNFSASSAYIIIAQVSCAMGKMQCANDRDGHESFSFIQNLKHSIVIQVEAEMQEHLFVFGFLPSGADVCSIAIIPVRKSQELNRNK